MKRRVLSHLLSAAAVCGLLSVTAPAFGEEPVINQGGIQGKAGTGNVKVTVKFDGEQKKSRPINTSADPFCRNYYQGKPPLLSEMFVFNDNNTLRNAVVYVSKGLEGKTFDVPASSAVIDQIGCRYVPHVNTITVNQNVEIRTSDQTGHNVKLTSKNNGTFNQTLPPVPGAKMDKKFNKTEMGMNLECNVHPWMKAFVCVFDHPFHAVTQDDGTVTISGLEPGEYEISVWHELSAFKSTQPSYKVTVEADGTTEVESVVSPPKK